MIRLSDNYGLQSTKIVVKMLYELSQGKKNTVILHFSINISESADGLNAMCFSVLKQAVTGWHLALPPLELSDANITVAYIKRYVLPTLLVGRTVLKSTSCQ